MITLIEFILMSNTDKVFWLSQYNDDDQVTIINQVRTIKRDVISILEAGYPFEYRIIKIGEVLLKEIGI